MSKNYTLGQRSIAYMLLVSLFLQSCGNFSRPLIALEEGQSEDTQELAEQIYIGEEEKELTAQEDRPENGQEMIINPSSQSQGAVIVSPGGLNGGGNGSGKERQEPKQEAIVTRSTLGELDRVPVDVLKIIFTYVGSKGMSQVRQLSKASYQLTTGYNKPELGVKYKPEASRLTDGLALNTRVLNFKSIKEALTPETIPGFPFYRLIGEVQHIPPSFWPYLAGTHVQTLNLYGNEIGNAGAVELAKHLKDTHVQTLNLDNN